MKSFSPTTNSVGVLMRSAWKNGYEILIQSAWFFHGGPISCSYCVMYMSLPYIEIWFALPAPLIAALKRCVGRNRVIGQDAAVAPPANAKAVRVDPGHLLKRVHGAEQVDHFLVAPVGENRLLKRIPAAVAAAVVHRDDDIAVGGKQLPLEVERVRVLAIGSAVDPQEDRILTGRRRIRPV